MLRLLTMVAVLAIVILGAELAEASMTPAERCAAAKQQAAGKKARSKLNCYATATKRGLAVDPVCLTRAEVNFTSAFAKAEAVGGCVTTMDAAQLEAEVDAFVANVVMSEPVVTTTSSSSTSTSSTTSTSSSTPTTPPPCVEGASCGSCDGGGICHYRCATATVECMALASPVIFGSHCFSDDSCTVDAPVCFGPIGCGGAAAACANLCP